MSLEYKLDSTEHLDQNIADLYLKTNEGQYLLNVAGIPEVTSTQTPPEPIELKNTLTKVRNEKKVLERELKQFKDIDIKHYEQLKKDYNALKAAENQKKQEEADEIARKTGEWESQKQNLIDQHSKELNVVKEKLANDQKTLVQTKQLLSDNLLSAEVTKSIANADGILDVLNPHIRTNLKIFNDNEVRVIDQSGNIRLDNQGEPMTTDQLVAEFKENPSFKGAFKQEVTTGGSNSVGNTSSESTIHNPFSQKTLNYTEQAFLTEKDPVLAKKLKTQALAEG